MNYKNIKNGNIYKILFHAIDCTKFKVNNNILIKTKINNLTSLMQTFNI